MYYQFYTPLFGKKAVCGRKKLITKPSLYQEDFQRLQPVKLQQPIEEVQPNEPLGRVGKG